MKYIHRVNSKFNGALYNVHITGGKLYNRDHKRGFTFRIARVSLRRGLEPAKVARGGGPEDVHYSRLFIKERCSVTEVLLYVGFSLFSLSPSCVDFPSHHRWDCRSHGFFPSCNRPIYTVNVSYMACVYT
jgi:hypothetical protein